MPRSDSTTTTLVVAALVAGAIGFGVYNWSTLRNSMRTATSQPAAADVQAGAAKAPARPLWTASAPGRVEPRGGEIRLGAQAAGRLAEVFARVNDRVAAGDLLLRLDDDDAVARLAAADSEVAVRRRERDGETVGRLATDRRNAEDQLSSSERALYQSRLELDRIAAQRRAGSATEEALTKARGGVATAREKVEQDRAALRKLQATAGMPLHTRLEASLASARSELAQAEAAAERTRLRAPAAGTVLQVHAKAGETVAPSPELVLVSFGDVSTLRARAEVEERDVAKIRIGQRAIVRSDAFAGREFPGVVTSLAQSLGAPRLASRGPRRPNDVDVLEVMVDLEGTPPVLPGMRVDIFFAPDATVQQSQPAVKAN